MKLTHILTHWVREKTNQVRKDKPEVIPESVFENKKIAELLNRWYKSRKLLVIELEKLHGMIQQ